MGQVSQINGRTSWNEALGWCTVLSPSWRSQSYSCSLPCQYAFADSLAPLKINDVDIKLTGDLLNYHAEVVGGVEGMDHIPHTHVDL